MDEHFEVFGHVAKLRGKIIDDNLNDLTFWLSKHINYAKREAIMQIISNKVTNVKRWQSVDITITCQRVCDQQFITFFRMSIGLGILGRKKRDTSTFCRVIGIVTWWMSSFMSTNRWERKIYMTKLRNIADRVAVFLPCRAGSKRVVDKNHKPFGGYEHGLIEIKLKQLLSVESISKIYVSTNDKGNIRLCKKLGASKNHGNR